MTTVKVSDYLLGYKETDNNITKLTIKLKELRDIQKKREPKILNIIQNSDYELNGFIFRTKEQNNKETITLKYLENILNTFYSDKADEILNCIKDNRKIETKYSVDIKLKK